MTDDPKTIPAVDQLARGGVGSGRLIHICASCHRIRDEKGGWVTSDESFLDEPGLLLTHAVCPECMTRLYPPQSYPYLYGE